jgi:hypothetical protein
MNRSARVLVAALLAVGGSACSAPLNSLTGLTTSTSAISGSNYVFMPSDGEEGCLVARNVAEPIGLPIGAGESFAVMLDFGFIRYFQAVDPYVIGYAASWMGTDPQPSDPEKMNQQLLFKKEGVGQNGRLSLTDVPLVGPVTLGPDNMPVTVTIKVVTLSRYDNAETISLLEQASSAVSAAQPQYAAAAQAAGALAAVIVSQNRDKIEFEHTFTFWPAGTLVPTSDPHHTHLALQPGRYVVLKGENETRNIPYQNWYYYLWPLNWLGHSPSGESRRFEAEDDWRYCARYDEVVVDGDYGLSALKTVPWVLGCAVRAPFYLVGDIFIAGQLEAGKPTPPELLWLDSDYLTKSSRCVDPYAQVSDRSRAVAQRLAAGNGWSIYAEKSHVVLRVARTAGSFGDFKTLVTRMSEQAQAINDLTTNRAEWEKMSADKQRALLDVIKSQAVARAASSKATSAAAEGTDLSSNDFCDTGLSCSERGDLVDQAIEAQVRRTVGLYVGFAKKWVADAKETAKNGGAAYDPTQLMPAVQKFAASNGWNPAPGTGVSDWDCRWVKAWKRVQQQAQEQIDTKIESTAGELTLQDFGQGSCGGAHGCDDACNKDERS